MFNIPSYFGVFLNSWPPAHWDPILSLHRINAIEVKIAPVLKTFMIFISYSILCPQNAPGFRINYGSKYARVLNKGSEYARFLNIPRF